MSVFESLVLLMLAAVILLQLSRRLRLPYPAMLAVAGVAVGFIPGATIVTLEPETALALFIAPVLLDAAFDFPLKAAGRLWRPLVVMALGAVLVTAAAVAWIGWAVAGLPIAAAVVLGAIVAPPDAAATTAVLGSLSVPQRTLGVLKGESLFNDATALILFGAALAIQERGGLTGGAALALGLAAPGGVLLGVALGLTIGRIRWTVEMSLGGNALQFVFAFLVWIVAEHLHLSAVLAVVAFAMTIARSTGDGSARMRVQSFAVWSMVVFLLNVLAFLLMGMQSRIIVGRMSPARLWEASEVAALVIVTVVLARFAVVVLWNRLAVRFPRLRGDRAPATLRQGLVVGWSGMRGLVSLATAFALPASFPQRDLVVLTAFAVVLATLVIQGLTLPLLIRLLGVDRMEDGDGAMAQARAVLIGTALDSLEGQAGGEADELRRLYRLKEQSGDDAEAARRLKAHRLLGLRIVAAQRVALDRLRDEEKVGTDDFYLLQEELDWHELTLLPEDKRQIAEV